MHRHAVALQLQLEADQEVVVEGEDAEAGEAAQQRPGEVLQPVVLQPQHLQPRQTRQMAGFNSLNLIVAQIKLLQCRQTEESSVAQP